MLGPAWGLDVVAGWMLWANADGLELFGLSSQISAPANRLAMDRAMPAFRQLAAILPTLADGRSRTETLVFWTGQGPRTVTCKVQCRDAKRQPGVVVVQAVVTPHADKTEPVAEAPRSIFPRRHDRERSKSAHAAPTSKADSSTEDRATPGPMAGRDLDVLQQIAKQIRQQRATSARPIALARTPEGTPTDAKESLVAPVKEPAGAVDTAAAARSAKRSQMAKRDAAWLADLGHELRTPLGSISGFAENNDGGAVWTAWP